MTLNARQALTKTFSIDYVSETDGRRYQGDFTIKKLTIRELAALGVRKSQLNGGMYFDEANPGRGVDEQTDDFNSMIAQLELSIKKHPAWWNLDDITDLNLITKVYKEVLAFESSFLRRDAERATTNRDGEGSGSGGVSQADASGSASPVVVQEVQAALEP